MLICCSHSLLTTLYLPHGLHPNFLYGESHVPAPEQKMFRDRTGPTLFQAETVPETVLVLSLVVTNPTLTQH